MAPSEVQKLKHKFEVAIAEALGINPDLTSRIIIDIDANKPLIWVYAVMVGAAVKDEGLNRLEIPDDLAAFVQIEKGAG